ncbi:MAG: hypothetical protein ABI833_22665, partial [Acidobacteriota bacterium]
QLMEQLDYNLLYRWFVGLTLTPPKAKKVGRPRLPKGDAKGRIVPVRFNAEDLKRITITAKASKMTISEWIRCILNAAINA